MHRPCLALLLALGVSLPWCAPHRAVDGSRPLPAEAWLTPADSPAAPSAEASAAAPVPVVSPLQLVDGGEALVQFCFAPDTDPAVVAYYEEKMHMPPTGERYFLGGRWSGSQGTPRALTWSFVPDGLSVDGGTSELFSRMDGLFGGNRALWITQFTNSFNRWAQLVGVSYTRITYAGNDWDDGASWGSNGSANRGDIRIAMISIDGTNNVLAYTYYPSNGDMVFDRSESWQSSSGTYRFLRDVIMHEHGHGLGIAHVCSTNANLLMEPYIDTSFDGPQDDDMRAGQRHYGDKSESNDTAATATNLGTAAIGSPINVGTNIPTPSISYASMLSIDADGKVDYFRFTTTGARAATVTVTPVGRTYDSSSQNGDGSCNSGNNINSLAMANLNLQVLGTDGTTVLATGASQPIGVAETVSGVYLPVAGNYYVKVYEGDSPVYAQYYRLSITVTDLDCNANGTLDPCDISCAAGGCSPPHCGGSLDCNANGLPDECELGPNDCNANNRPDDCDIANGTSHDCQLDGTPDECQTAGHDCNGNTTPDVCDIAAGTSADCQPDGTPDECQTAGHDCNGNAVPDGCDIAAGTSADCQPDGTPDECQIAGNDCDANGRPDECDPDCNQNGIADACDIAAGSSQDCNTNGRPDQCDTEHCQLLWNGFQDSAFQTPMNGLDLDGDGHAWSNPSGTATIWAFGCESGEGVDLFAETYAPTSSPENGYLVSEYFRTAGGTLYPDEDVYALSFKARLKLARNAKSDWQIVVYDAVHAVPAVHIQLASTVSSYPGISVPADRGYILVKNRLGSPTFVNTGVATVLDTCTEFRVELNNFDHTVQLYIDGVPKLNPPVVVFNATARRLDYFRLTAANNLAAAGGNTMIDLDGFHLCATGTVLPANQWDCNGNGILDECDIASGWSADCNANGIPEECERGDFNGDLAVDLTDYQAFQACYTGPGVALGAGCTEGDFDCDNDIDLHDFAAFQWALPAR